ncbi:MAG: T9SS type A sorting domain-containing protein [Chitinophagales bacterium]|nr:T9SS type A sorting domain-containing protein [Chitinophagales bacterium]
MKTLIKTKGNLERTIRAILTTAAALLLLSTMTYANSKSFTFTNNTGEVAKDLHIEFQRSTNYVSQTPANSFENQNGDGTSRQNFGQGTGTGVPAGGSIKIKVSWPSGSTPKVKKAWWTNSGDEDKINKSDKIGNYLKFDRASGEFVNANATGNGQYMITAQGIPYMFQQTPGDLPSQSAAKFATFIDNIDIGAVLALNGNVVDFTIYDLDNPNNIDIQIVQMDLTQPFIFQTMPMPTPPEFTQHQQMSANDFMLMWEPHPLADHYLLQGWDMLLQDTIHIEVPVGSNGIFPVDNLPKGRDYVWRVATSYEPSGEYISGYSFAYTISTYCPAPSTVFTAPIGTTNAVLNWSAVENSIGYGIFGRQQGTSQVVSIQIPGETSTSYSANGLSGATTYEYAVVAYCDFSGNIVQSAFSPIEIFTTQNSSTMKSIDGILETTGSDLVSIYPNPAHQKVTVKSIVENDDGVRVRVFNNTGKLVYATSLNESNESVISTQFWSNGLYTVEVEGQSGRKVHKLVIAH